MTIQEAQTLQILKRKYKVRHAEQQRKEQPMKLDISSARRVLNDFNISAEIPQFNTYAELETWLHNKIKGELSKC